MALLKIAQLGNSILRESAQHVKDVNDPHIRDLIASMIETCVDAGGLAISAPQVYRSLQIFVVISRPNPSYPEAPEFGPVAIINPQIVHHYGDIEEGWEGCLSLPFLRAKVKRHQNILVHWQDSTGKFQKTTHTGLLARIFQHEDDHLSGKMFTDPDRSSPDSFMTDEEWRKMKAREMANKA